MFIWKEQIDGGLLKELFPTGKYMEPAIARITDYKMALSRDEATIFIDADGNPTQKSVLTWSELPIAMSQYSHWFFLGYLLLQFQLKLTLSAKFSENGEKVYFIYLTHSPYLKGKL